MDKELSVGQTDDTTQVATWRTRKREKEHSHGQMVAATMDHGRTVSSMEEENSQIERVKSKRANGSKANEYFGTMSLETGSSHPLLTVGKETRLSRSPQ